VTVAEKQQQMLADLLLIEDPQERLAAIVDRARPRLAVSRAEHTDDNRVRGCVSPVWVVCESHEGRCRFRSDAESPLVRGIVALVCDLYSDAAPADIVATEPALIEQLGLLRTLSPTRLNGLRSVRARIRDYATGLMPAP
jgi:cysteine desulfuration protein SufE